MIDNLLEQLEACNEARDWASGKSWEEIYNTCNRGDWLLWLFIRTNPDDKRLRVLAAGHCANTVRHLMKDDRSINAVDVAIAYGEGRATEEELTTAAYAAAASYAAAAAYATYAANAVYAAAYAYAAATYAASAAYAYAASAAAYDANQQQTADIVRKYITIDKFNIKED